MNTLPVRDLQLPRKETTMRLVAVLFAALTVMLTAPSVMADAPVVSVAVWHPDQWAVVTSADASLAQVAYYPDLAAAKRGINAQHPTRIDWHGVYQASAPTACGTFTAEEREESAALGAATHLANLLDCAPTAPATVAWLP
jgi:hypothetical protein